ncbi:hypothetical protein D3C85_518970 [compost metagenome]
MLPDSVSVDAPALVRVLAPLTTPDRVASAELLTLALPLRTMPLSMVVAPVIASVLPVARFTAPLPRLLSLATLRVPALTVVVPE